MTTYKAPLTDIRFALYDVLGADALFARLGYVDATARRAGCGARRSRAFHRDRARAAERGRRRRRLPLRQASGDVATPTGFKQAFDQFVAGGWTGLTRRRRSSAARACRMRWARRSRR